jgi:microcystin-dependent protein
MTDSLPRSGAAPMAGALKLTNGTVSSPGVSFNSASGSGLYKTTDGFGVAINGVQVAEFTAGGLTKGSRYIGELIPWTGTTAPARCVLPYGQTLSRTTYADLWAFAQLQIAAGNLFYNNGDGSTTFGVGDLRGRAIAAPDGMGGSDAGRLVGGVMSARLVVGGSGGEAVHSLTAAEIPQVGVSVAGNVNVSSDAPSGYSFFFANGDMIQIVAGASNLQIVTFPLSTQSTRRANITASGVNTLTGATTSSVTPSGHNTLPPTLLCNFALYAGA